MKYWVIKGNPLVNDWDDMLVPETIGEWHTKRPPSGWKKGDRIFCWESKPYKRIIGLAELTNPLVYEEPNGDKIFRIRYLTTRLPYMPNIEELRRVEELKDAVFLKSGPAMAVLPVSNTEAKKLFSILLSECPSLEKVWLDLAAGNTISSIPDVDMSAVEGRAFLASHLRRERSAKLVAAKKRQALTAHRRLECEVCAFDFAHTYGQLGKDFCEVHHRKPLAKIMDSEETKLSDLAIVCSNCHRMLHRSADMSVEGLRAVLHRTLDPVN
jgi:predicted RNA-binding protein with PUA-like domain